MSATQVFDETRACFELNQYVERTLLNLATARVIFRREGASEEELEPINVAMEKIRAIRKSVLAEKKA